jgi:TatD DNase family protein
MFVDSHCHLEMEEFDADRDAVMARAAASGVAYMLTVATEERYFSKAIEIARANERVYAAIGVHPHNAAGYSEALEKRIRGYLAHPKIVGYGEIGLDFYRNYSPKGAQMEAFERQIALAREARLPIIIHSRNARAETLEVLKRAAIEGHPTIIHCYSYDVDTARKVLDMGIFLSIPGTVTYKNSGLAEVLQHVPLERLLSETDAPFLAPSPHRGKRNEPANVLRVVEEIARIRRKDPEEIGAMLTETFTSLFLRRKVECSGEAPGLGPLP